MINLNKRYKETFNRISLSKERSNVIYQNIILKEKKNKIFFRYAIGCTITLFVIMGGLGIVYAKEIKNFMQGLKKVQINENKVSLESDSLAEINYDANLPEAEVKSVIDQKNGIINNNYTFRELEELLGVKLLKSEYFKTDALYQFLTKKVDNKISYAVFDLKNFTQEEKYNDEYNMTIRIITKYNENPSGTYMEAVGFKTEEYYISSLNTTAYIFKPFNETISTQSWLVSLVFNNIHYDFSFRFVNKDDSYRNEQIIKILESLKY